MSIEQHDFTGFTVPRRRYYRSWHGRPRPGTMKISYKRVRQHLFLKDQKQIGRTIFMVFVGEAFAPKKFS